MYSFGHQENLDSLSREELASLVQRRSREINFLLELGRRLKEHFHLESLLKELMESMAEIIHSQSCSLFLVEESTEDIFFYLTTDHNEDYRGISLKKGQGIVGQVVESGRSVIVEDVSQHPSFFPGVDKKTGFETRSLICVPMKIGNRVIGAIEVLNKRNNEFFNGEDLQLLEILAVEAAMAIEYVKATEQRLMSERLSTVGNMAAQFIHDLKNSMQAISGFTQIMVLDNPEFKRFGEMILGEIKRVKSMAHEVLDYSRGVGATCTLEPVEMRLFLQSVFDEHHNILQMDGVDFQYHLNGEAVLQLDRIKMERVLRNIIKNAWESLEGEDKRIVLEGGVLEGRPYFLIRDTGKGMGEDVLSNIFKPFYTSGKKDGTGLGMAIVHGIVEAHNAQIDVESAVGVGTTFRILFPPVR